MGFVRFNEHGYLLDKDGAPFYLAGINYVARYVCTNFWEDWRPDAIDHDLRTVANLKLNAVRIPVHWGFFEPEEGRCNPLAFERFDWFVGKCREYGLYVMPWFLVGVATNEYDVPFRNGRPFMTGGMADAAAAHLAVFAKRYRHEEQILAWDICDEPEWYSRLGNGAETLPYDRAVSRAWVARMYDAFKKNDPDHLVTLGFGHIATNHFGMDIRDMAGILDFMAVTAYPGVATEGVDKPRASYFISFSVMFNRLGKPVFLCESPGHSTVLFSEEVIGRMFRTTLYSGWIHGSAGAMPWALNDFDEMIWHQDPLDRYPAEVSFGIIGENGRMKDSARVLMEFADTMRRIRATDYDFPEPETAILLPRDYYKGLPDTFYNVYAAFTIARGADIPVRFAWWDEDLPQFKMVILASTNGFTTPDWSRICRYAEEGGALLCIPDGRGVLNGYFERMFGARMQSPQLMDPQTSLNMEGSWHGWEPGESISMSACSAGEYLRVSCGTAQTLARFPNGDPALTMNSYGQGRSFLFTFSALAGLLKCGNDAWRQSPLFGIFEAVGEEAGIKTEITCTDRSVEVALMKSADGNERLAIAVNHDDFAVNARIDLFLTGVDAESVEGNPIYLKRDRDRVSMNFELPAAGVRIVRVKPCEGKNE